MNVIFKEAQKKGYFPLCYTGNLFLIKNLYQNLFTPYLKSLKELYTEYLEFLPSNELKYLYYYFIIKRDFSDKGITDDGAIFSNPELWHFCGDLAIKNRDKLNEKPNIPFNNKVNNKPYKPTYLLNQQNHQLSNNNNEIVKSRVPYPTQTQIPTMNPHKVSKQQPLTSTKPRPVFLRGSQHQPKKHPSYKIPFPTLASNFPNNNNNNQQNYEYKFGNPQPNINNLNEGNNISFIDYDENNKKEERIEELEKHIESLYREIKNLRYD
jgi:hypothetical protein